MDHLVRVDRLRKLLGRLAPESHLENLQPQLEVLRTGNPEEEIAQAGLDVLMSGNVTDLEQTGALEAIVHKRYRPVVNIINDTFAAPPAPWTALGTGDFRTRIESTIRSIGRIEVPNDPRGRPYAGTGFVVGENLLMTNRHVAMIFATGLGQRGLAFIPGQSVGIDFKQEVVPSTPQILTVTAVVMIHPYWDLALLRVSGLTDQQKILTLSVNPADGTEARDIVVIGYPAQDDRNPMALQNEIFGGVFNVKRLQPGKLLARRDMESFGRIVNAVTHDSSTLGGNSGSAVVDASTGQIIGLHFAGLYLDANFAVPSYELARDQRVVNAGVTFGGSVGLSDIYPPVWKLADAGESIPATVTKPGEPRLQSPATSSPATSSPTTSSPTTSVLNLHPMLSTTTASWTIPLQLTITAGMPTRVDAGASGDDQSQRREGLFGRHRPLAAAEAIPSFSVDSLAATTFSWRTALSLALASQLSYETPAVVQNTTRNVWGLETCEFIESNDTQCFVATSPAAVLVAFRGTENLGDWMINLNLLSTEQSYGTVHRGFLSGLQFVQPRLRQVLATFPGRPILLTGHSLGGALATIAAAEWQGQFNVRGIYTYGQPCVGKGTFPTFINSHYGSSFFRFVNDDDIVPRVPPTYQHVGRLFHFDAQGNVHGGATESLSAFAEAMTPDVLNQAEFEQLQQRLREIHKRPTPAGFTEAAVPATEGIFPSFSDHSLAKYVSKIAAKVN